MKTYNLKLLILLPITLISLLVTTIFIVDVYYKEQDRLSKELSDSASAVEEIFLTTIEERSSKLSAALELIALKSDLIDDFVKQDREALYALAKPLFENLKAKHNITHFYFHDPMRRNLLRVHQPDHSGDIIDRYTAHRAEETKKIAYGMETGPLGTLTLRVVKPIWHQETLLGYIELGEEIEGVINTIHDVISVELLVIVNKKYLKKVGWQVGMEVLQRESDWNQFSERVVISQTMEDIPQQLGKYLSGPESELPFRDFNLRQADQHYRGQLLPLRDVSGRTVGNIVLLRNMTASIHDSWERVVTFAVTSVGVALLLFLAFYFILERVERKLSRAIKALECSKKDLSHIQHLSHVGSWNYDVRTGLITLSDTAYDILEVSSEIETMNYDQMLSYVLTEDRERVEKNFHKALADSTPYQMDYRIQMRDGRIKYIHESCELLLDHLDKPINATIIIQNVTDQRQASALSQRLGRIFEHSWNEIYMFDAATYHFIDASKGALNNLGYSLEELRHLTPFDIRPNMSCEQFFDLVKPLKTGRVHQVTFETEHQRKDGSIYPVEVRLQLSKEQSQSVYISIIQDITERKSYIEELEYKALYDALTQLPNRYLLKDRLAHAIKVAEREKGSLAMFIVDLTRLRMINDVMGYHNGDLVIQNVADRLRDELRESDTIARLSDGEFAIILPKVGITNVYSTIEKLQVILDKPFMIEGAAIEIEAVIGVAFYPNHASDPDELIRYADIAMHLAKKQTKRVNIYDNNDNLYNLKRLKLYGELREAIEKNALILFYQPKVDIKTGEVKGVEALARWFHPEEGEIPPDGFIPIIEKTGLIQPFTRWVLHTAIAQSKQWSDKGIELKVAVNLSTRNLLDPNLPDYIADLLAKYSVAPESIVLEITESAVMYDPTSAIKLLERLHDMGFSLSIDDFGTGYSSLTYLKQMPIQELKIDQSFVFGLTNDMDNEAIVRSTIELAHNLGMFVIAEGVETEPVMEILNELGCDIGQGYLFSRPISPEALEAWLKSSKWGPKRLAS